MDKKLMAAGTLEYVEMGIEEKDSLKTKKEDNMPIPVFHLWIAREYAKGRPDLYNNSDYYLGNIAPDAIYTRENYTAEWKNRTHLFTDRNTWERDAMRSFRLIQEPTAFEIGYYMHILTDIQFRNKCRGF